LKFHDEKTNAEAQKSCAEVFLPCANDNKNRPDDIGIITNAVAEREMQKKKCLLTFLTQAGGVC
ncbi:MAG: hypothetical protein J1F13_00730, partial [Prevotellaceae bacterium]|nr:hypothetical protein [Prevotellaceae bacterium]